MPSALDVEILAEIVKCHIIGPPGTGKSIFAATFPTKGFVFDFSNGILSYRGLDFDYEQYSITPEGWTKFERDLLTVAKAVADGVYKTVIVDDTTGMGDVAMARAMQLDPKRSATNGPIWNVHYGMVRNMMEGKLHKVKDLKCNVIVISHMETIKDDETGAVVEVKPLLTGQLAHRLPGYFDEVYYSMVRKESSGIKWLLQTVPIGLKGARSRLSGKERLLPDFIDNNYPALIEHIRKAQQATSKKK